MSVVDWQELREAFYEEWAVPIVENWQESRRFLAYAGGIYIIFGMAGQMLIAADLGLIRPDMPKYVFGGISGTGLVLLLLAAYDYLRELKERGDTAR